MKINFTMWDLLLNGGTRIIFELANRLVERGHEVTIMSSKKRDVSWFPLKAQLNIPRSQFFLRTIDYCLRKIKPNANLDLIKSFAKIILECNINVGTFYRRR